MLTIINGFVFSRQANGTGISLSSWWTGSEKWKAHEFTKDDQQAVKLAAKGFRPLQGELKPWT